MAESANRTSGSTPKTMAGLDTMDCIRSGALIVMFLSITFKDRKTWLLADSILVVCVGLMHFLRPDLIINHISFEGDDNIQCYIVQAFAAFVVADGVYRCLVKNSRDQTVLSSLIWSRAISLMVVTFIGFTTHYGTKKTLRPEHLSFVILGNCAWLVSTLVQLWRYVNPMGGVEKTGPVTWLLRLDFIILFVTALAYMAYPGWIMSFQVRTVGPIYRYLLRVFGCGMLHVAIQGQQATAFRYDADRTAYFISRVASFVLVGVALAYSYLYEGLFNRKELMCACVMFTHGIPSVIGLILSLRGQGSPTSGHRYSSSSTTYYTRSSKHAY